MMNRIEIKNTLVSNMGKKYFLFFLCVCEFETHFFIIEDNEGSYRIQYVSFSLHFFSSCILGLKTFVSGATGLEPGTYCTKAGDATSPPIEPLVNANPSFGLFFNLG